MSNKKKIAIIGNAGAGKSLAYELAKNKCGLPIVVCPKGEQLDCDHQFINAGTLQGRAMKRCLKCGNYTQEN